MKVLKYSGILWHEQETASKNTRNNKLRPRYAGAQKVIASTQKKVRPTS